MSRIFSISWGLVQFFLDINLKTQHGITFNVSTLQFAALQMIILEILWLPGYIYLSSLICREKSSLMI